MYIHMPIVRTSYGRYYDVRGAMYMKVHTRVADRSSLIIRAEGDESAVADSQRKKCLHWGIVPGLEISQAARSSHLHKHRIRLKCTWNVLLDIRFFPCAVWGNYLFQYTWYAHLDNEELLPVGSNVEEDALDTSRERYPAHQEGNEYDIRKQSWKYNIQISRRNKFCIHFNF